jgi:hypothetical protein
MKNRVCPLKLSLDQKRCVDPSEAGQGGKDVTAVNPIKRAAECRSNPAREVPGIRQRRAPDARGVTGWEVS